MANLPLGQRLFVGLQYLLPQHPLSRLMCWLTRLRLGPVTHWLIRRFVEHFAVELQDAAEPRVAAYADFNAFFTRALAPNARPLPPQRHSLVSPVDGVVSECGELSGDRLLQCKGRDYSIQSLFGGDAELAAPFLGGLFATLYLSPRDYHRIHMPIDGRLRTMVHVPGRLFSVNPTTVAGVPGLFARNERVLAVFDTALGPIALVLVGAIFVGSIETRWSGVVTPPRARALHRQDYPPESGIRLNRGEELGRFNMGSTVILLLPAGRAVWSAGLQAGARLRCRAEIARTLA